MQYLSMDAQEPFNGIRWDAGETTLKQG